MKGVVDKNWSKQGMMNNEQRNAGPARQASGHRHD